MKQKFRKHFSLFLLGIFLFSYTGKGIHDFLHTDDFHCHALNAKHIHNAMHHCAICDFVFPFYDNSLAFKQPSFVRCAANANFFTPEQPLAFGSSFFLSARAPPLSV